MRIRSHVVPLVVFMLGSRLAFANAEQPEQPPSQTHAGAATYMTAVIQSLARDYRAMKAVNDAADKPSLVDRMTTIRNARIELGLCQLLLKDFTSDSDEHLRVSAAGMLTAFDMQRKALSMLLDLYERLDVARNEQDLAGMRTTISETKSLYQQSELALVDASMIAFMSGMVPDPKDPENHVALDMTAREGKELLDLLQREFGPAMRTKPSSDDTAALKIARLLRDKFREDWRYAR